MVESSDMKPDANAPESAGAWSARATSAPRQPRGRRQVDALVAEANSIRRLDYDRLTSLAEEAFELASQPDDAGNQYRFGMASALALLAHLSSVRGDSEAALQQTSQALALLDSHEPSAVLGDLYLTMAWTHYQTGDYVDALERPRDSPAHRRANRRPEPDSRT